MSTTGQGYLGALDHQESSHFPLMTSPALGAFVSQCILWKDAVNQGHQRHLLANNQHFLKHLSYSSALRMVTTQSVSPSGVWSDIVTHSIEHPGHHLITVTLQDMTCALFLGQGIPLILHF